MSDNIVTMKKQNAEEYLRHLKEHGYETLTILDPKNEEITKKPQWLDEERFQRAKLACEKFYVGIAFSSFTGLLLVLQLPDGLEPLLSTGNSKDLPSLYKRYLSTIIHVKSWYEDDIFNPETKAYKSMRQVRSMHRRVSVIMNEKFQVPAYGGKQRVWLNQYDMAMTQFAFIGLAMIYPKKSGLISATIDELESINYYWRVLGHCMGIKDEFNLCQFDSYDDISQVNKLLFEQEYKQVLETQSCQMGLEMTQGICEALHFYMPLLTFNNLAHWWSECFHFNGYQPQAQSFKEKILAAWMKLSFDHLLNYPSLLLPFARLHKRQFERRLKKKDAVYGKLVEKCKQDQQELRFVSDRCDYFKNITTSCPFRVDTAYASHFESSSSSATQPNTADQKQSDNNDQVEASCGDTNQAVNDINGNKPGGQRESMMVKPATTNTAEQQRTTTENPDSYPIMSAPPIVAC